MDMKREDLINAIGQIDGKTVKSTEKKLKSEKKGGRALLINTVTALVLLAILVPIIKLAVTRGRNSGSEGVIGQTQDSGREAHEAVTDVLLVNDLVSFDEMKSAFYNVMNDTVEIGKFRFYTLKTESDFEELKEKYGDLIQDPPFYYNGFFNDCDMVAVIFGEKVVMNRRDVSAEISPDGGVFIDAPAPEANDFGEALSTSCILLDTGRKAGKYYLAKVGLGDYFGGYSIKIEGIEYTLGSKKNEQIIYYLPLGHGKIEVLGLSELRFRTNSGTIDAVDAFRCGAVTVDILKDYLDSTGCSVMFHGSGIQHETYYFDEITVDLISGGQFAVKFIAPEYEHWTEESEDETTETLVSATEPVVTDGPQSEISEPMTEPVTEPWTEDPSETTAPVPTCDDESYILFFEENKKAMTMLIAGDDMEEIYALAEPMSSEREAVLRRYITGVPEEDWELIPDDFGGFGSALTMFRIDGVWYWAEWSEGYAVEVGEDYWWKRILYFGAVQTPDDMNSELRRALRPD